MGSDVENTHLYREKEHRGEGEACGHGSEPSYFIKCKNLNELEQSASHQGFFLIQQLVFLKFCKD